MDIVSCATRYMVKPDLEHVLNLELTGSSPLLPLREEEVLEYLYSRNVLGIVAGDPYGNMLLPNSIRGWMVLQFGRTHIRILRLLVHRDHRHRGIGTTLLNEAKARANIPKKPRRVLVDTMSRDGRLEGWLSLQGFLCITTKGAKGIAKFSWKPEKE